MCKPVDCKWYEQCGLVLHGLAIQLWAGMGKVQVKASWLQTPLGARCDPRNENVPFSFGLKAQDPPPKPANLPQDF